MNIAIIGYPDYNLLIHVGKRLKEYCKEDRAKTSKKHLFLQ
jgi:hypothetical protein